MTDCKLLEVRLFYNMSNRTFYINIGNSLCPVRDKVITQIQEREQLEIVHVADIKEMQIYCNRPNDF